MKKPDEKLQRILIIRTDRIGDVVLSLPVASALRKRFPKSHLAMLVRPSVSELVTDHPDLNGVLFDGSAERGVPGFFRLINKIRKERFDAALILHPTLRLAAVMALAGIPIRVGTGFRMYSFLFNRKVFEHRRHSFKHEAEFNLSLAGKLGAGSGPIEFRIRVPDEAKKKVEAFLRKKRIQSQRPLVILHPGSRGSALDWPVSSFIQLAGKLEREAGAFIVVTGGKHETAIADRIVRPHSSRTVSAAGQFNLKELCALLGKADLFISNSTGPLHLARAVGTDVIGFYPPLIPASPKRWGPYGENDGVLTPDLPECKKCKGRRCPEWNCMDRISVDDAYRLAVKKIGRE